METLFLDLIGNEVVSILNSTDGLDCLAALVKIVEMADVHQTIWQPVAEACRV